VPSGEVLGTFDVGGRKLNLRCYGTGSPAVVFENAHGADSAPYENLARQVGAETSACVYDRANLGLSDPRSTTPDELDVDKDLTPLLAAAKVPPPCVFAGHVNGGPLALLHAAEHTGGVRGLVLLDAEYPGAVPRSAPSSPRASGGASRHQASARSVWISIAWQRRCRRGCMTCRRSR
jgi:pimeloyl-ACP methyl ester carboxylesterase